MVRIRDNGSDRHFAHPMTEDPDKTIYDRASGTALETVNAHSKETDLKCFFSWFCPYVSVLGFHLTVRFNELGLLLKRSTRNINTSKFNHIINQNNY